MCYIHAGVCVPADTCDTYMLIHHDHTHTHIYVHFHTQDLATIAEPVVDDRVPVKCVRALPQSALKQGTAGVKVPDAFKQAWMEGIVNEGMTSTTVCNDTYAYICIRICIHIST